MRDSLSLFDQAIAHAAGPVRAEDVRQMLGLADRVRVVDLFEALMKGDVAAALKNCASNTISAPIRRLFLSDLAEFTHFVTRVKVVPAVADDVSLSEAERTRGRAFAAQLSMRVLSRAWQMLFKASPRCRPPAVRSPRPRWCWCASLMPPICRRRTKWSARSARTAHGTGTSAR